MVATYSLDKVIKSQIRIEANKKLINVLGILFLDFKNIFFR